MIGKRNNPNPISWLLISTIFYQAKEATSSGVASDFLQLFCCKAKQEFVETRRAV
jgi:hypothetical protein